MLSLDPARNPKMSILLRTDITAVYLSAGYIYCGIGSRLHIYNRQPPHGIVRVLQVLEQGVKIHGVVGGRGEGESEGEGKELVVWGEGQVCALQEEGAWARQQGQVEAGPGPVMRVRGWVLAAATLTRGQLALLTAHNHLLVYERGGGVWQEAWRVEQWEGARGSGALRSARLAPLPVEGGLLVGGGTAHKALLLTYLPPHQSKPPPHHTHLLLGHQGVVLAVEVSVEARAVASACDDRTVRVWRPAVPALAPASATWAGPWACVAELRAHSARPLALALTPARLYSTGEDATLCTWQLAPSLESGAGSLVSARSLQPGAELWAVCADSGAVLTGGGDAALLLHSASAPPPLQRTLASPPPAPAHTPPKKLAYTHEGLLLAVCEHHQLLVYDSEGGDWSGIPLEHESTFKMLAVSECGQLVAAAGGEGRMDVWAAARAGGLVHVAGVRLHGPLLALAWAGSRRLVASASAGALLVLGLQGESGAMEVVARLLLPGGRARDRWLVAAAHHARTDTLLLADRAGDLHFYKLHQQTPTCTLKRIHGPYGPTSISVRNDVVTTTGRDGCIRHFWIDADETIRRLHKIDLPFEWVERFVDKDHTLVCGFQEREFVIYDLKSSCVVVRVECGGGHRAWTTRTHFQRRDDYFRKHITFVFMKNSQLHVTTECLDDVLPKSVIPGIHAREINSLIRLDVRDVVGGGDHYLLSAGEDTTLRISRTDAQTYIVDEYVLRHLSSVRAIDAINFGDDKILIASGGGRGQICIRVMHVRRKQGRGIELLVEELVDELVRGTERARRGPRSWREHFVQSQPDIRIMDVKLHGCKNESFNLFAGCSDGLIRVFAFDPRDESSFHAIGVLKHHTTCILKLSIFQLNNNWILVSTSTLGDVVFWNIDNKNINSALHPISVDSKTNKEMNDQEKNIDVNPFFITRTNKSGINSLSVLVMSEMEVIVATGGDDNAIHVVNLMEENGGVLKEKWHVCESEWHSGQVTGLQLLKGEEDEVLMVSASVDQLVTLGAVARETLETGKMTLRRLQQVCVHVADAHGLQLIPNDGKDVCVCVYGKGVETLQLAP